MAVMVTKLYCYVDETGQDTGRELFWQRETKTILLQSLLMV